VGPGRDGVGWPGQGMAWEKPGEDGMPRLPC
jgi:hypothetical protein